ncbi:MAG: ChrR family anti-sigma-E factor [Marinibacterium sp.]
MTHDIKHHLTDDLLMAYSAGTLDEAVSLMVATHISLCDRCRADLAAYDGVGGALLDREPPAGDHAATQASFQATLARITAGPDAEDPAPPARIGGVLPAPLQDYVGGDVDAIRWRSVGMGVKQAILKTAPGATARLLFIPAGAAVPDHGHNGLELTLVLQGAFSDETDTFARGDVEIADESLEHMPVADIGADCICLAVTDAPLKFRGLLPRLAQPFLRI